MASLTQDRRIYTLENIQTEELKKLNRQKKTKRKTQGAPTAQGVWHHSLHISSYGTISLYEIKQRPGQTV